jgi:hypothetical protein
MVTRSGVMAGVPLALPLVPLVQPRHQRQGDADAVALRAGELPGLDQQLPPQAVFSVHCADRVQGIMASSRASGVFSRVSSGTGFAPSCGATVSPLMSRTG